MGKKHVRKREDSPNEAARRALTNADHILVALRSYCVRPQDERDAPGPLQESLDVLDSARERLDAVRPLTTGGYYGDPRAEVLQAVEDAVEVITLIHARTFAQKHLDTAAELVVLRQVLGSARASGTRLD